jgi:hypothetical protein
LLQPGQDPLRPGTAKVAVPPNPPCHEPVLESSDDGDLPISLL